MRGLWVREPAVLLLGVVAPPPPLLLPTPVVRVGKNPVLKKKPAQWFFLFFCGFFGFLVFFYIFAQKREFLGSFSVSSTVHPDLKKKIQNLKKPKNPKTNNFFGFFRWVFWVGFFRWVFYCQPCL